MLDIATLYVTAASRSEALQISETLLNERLAACANILDGMTSVFRWEGRIQHATESVLLLKTRVPLVDDAVRRIRELHSYEVPCIVAWRSIGGNEDYFHWVHAETSASSPPIA
jgi:periplasmic divalent cation tolerance protein